MTAQSNLAAGFPVNAKRRAFAWLEDPRAYTFGSPLMTVIGSGTTIAAPIVLNPSQFATLALLTTVFMYTADFDLGLGRLADRELTRVDPQYGLQEFIVARVVIFVTLCVGVGLAGLYFGSLFAIAGWGGCLLMVNGGPATFYRARSQIYEFTLTASVGKFGLGVPRFAGLLLDGVRGAVLTLLIWYAAMALVVVRPFFHLLKAHPAVYRCPILISALPLFAFNYLWLIYLLSNRWFSWSVSSEHDTGLFAFGATLLYVGVGVLTATGQVYYPKHLASTGPARLAREIQWVLLIVTAGVIIGVGFCRYAVPLLFPHFAESSLSSAAILLSGVPLCLTAWITPIVIARSQRPWRESVAVFGSSIALLYASMALGAHYGVIGQSFACLPSAVLLLVSELMLLRNVDLTSGDIAKMLVYITASLLFCGGLLRVLF